MHWAVFNGLFTLVCLFVSATAEASYFVDTPPESIELRMAGCFADTECAAQAERLIPLFAKSEGRPVDDVRDVLANCVSPDSNMGFCVMYEVFAVTDELEKIVQARLQKNPRDKAALPVRDMKRWRRRLEKECFRKVEKDTPGAGGLYLSEQVIACESERAMALVIQLR
jgi:hypothetical protein